MAIPLDNEQLRRILSLHADDRDWRGAFDRLWRGDAALTRQSAGESAIKALQRLLVFLGYSTAATGAFLIDGDFGRGTNRGVAQFQFEHGLNPGVTRQCLSYPCTANTAASCVVSVPDVSLDRDTAQKLADVALDSIARNEVPFGNFDDALFHLNSLHERRRLDCREILARYGGATRTAVSKVRQEAGVTIMPEWILAIIKQETAGVAKPRFEQHKLSRLAAQRPLADLAELRIESMSIGLGQIMGFNFKHVGAASARAMLCSPLEEQVLYVARFVARKKDIVSRTDPSLDDFRAMAAYYNGPGYAKHFYHEQIERWFREFRQLGVT